MNTPVTNGPGGADHGHAGSGATNLKAALISADDNLRRVVRASIEDAVLPLRLDLEIAAPMDSLEREHMAQLRASEPHVVILDMSNDPERAILAAGAIANCSPRSALVGVGPDLDAPRLLEAMRAGLVEYLPRPVEPDSLREALARVLHKRGWSNAPDTQRNGEVLAFFSAKGGSGSTSVLTNLGIELHRLTGRRTLLVDLDLELGEITSMLGLRPRFHFVDLVRNFHRMDEDLLDSYIESHESGVHVLSAPFEPQIGEEVTGEQIGHILGFLRSHYDYVLVDTSKSLAPPALATLQIADPIFLITNMDVPSLRNLQRCLPTLDRVTAGDPDRLRLVVNRYNPKSLVQRQDLEETLGLEIFATLCNDYATVIQAISTSQPLVLHGNSRYADEVRQLARSIAYGPNETVRKPSLVRRMLSPFRSSPARTRPSLKPTAPQAVTHG